MIDQLDIDLSTGFHVITGETGSGKSILLDAILFCLGYKFDTQIIKKGAESCIVAIEAKVPESLIGYLHENSIEHDGYIIIKRQQFENNRKKIFINDQIVTQKLIDVISSSLLEIHGQNTHSSLLDPSSHIDIIDTYGALEQNVKEVSKIYSAWQQNARALDEIRKERNFIDKEIDYLEFVVNELTELNINIREEEELSLTRIELQKQEKNKKLVKEIYDALTSPSIDSQILSAQKIINRQDKDNAFKEVIENLDQALVFIDEATKFLESKMQDTEILDIDSIEERLFAIRAMARKHNIKPDDLANYLTQSQTKLTSLKNKITEESNLIQNIENIRNQYFLYAQNLSSLRKEISKNLEEKIASELGFLKMENAVFKVDFANTDTEHSSSYGIDKIRFIASTNPGSDMAAIDKIASGGELSRFMLAIKVALFDKFTKPTIIFDEIDTGIGGVVADAVGERLKYLGKASQVLVITHQPQVAGKANNHIFVYKTQDTNKTSSTAKMLSKEERLDEIARMISGQKITSISKKAAEELIK